MCNIRVLLVRVYLYTVLLDSLRVTDAAVETNETRLHQELFKNYNRNILPVLNKNGSVKVTFDVQIIRIIDVSEKEQFIKTYTWINQYWNNPLLQWNPSEYGGIQEIQIHPHQVWVPDILLYNNVDEEDRLAGGSHTYKTSISVTYDGNTTWLNPALFKSICRIDVTNFPFDDQECHLKFGSWSSDQAKIDLYPQKTYLLNDNYIRNGEWELLNISAKRNVKKYICCPHPFVDVTVMIKIRRESIDYILKLIIPCSLISSMIFLGFILPPESGERIGLSITVLLAMTVFQQLTSEIMPSYGFPLLGQYYFATMVEIGLSLLITTTILNIYHRNNRRMPNILRKIILKWLYSFLFPCKRRNSVWEIEKDSRSLQKYRNNRRVSSYDGDLESNSDFSFDETMFENPTAKTKNDPWLCLSESKIPYKASALNGTNFGGRHPAISNNLSQSGHLTNVNSTANSRSPLTLAFGFEGRQNEKQRKKVKRKNRSFLDGAIKKNTNESMDFLESKERNQKEWIRAARVLDRFILIISVLTGVLTLFTIFLKAPRFGILVS